MEALTLNMKRWLKSLYRQEIDEALGIAKHEHLCALGSNTTKETTMHETNADECREYARILEDMIKELDMPKTTTWQDEYEHVREMVDEFFR